MTSYVPIVKNNANGAIFYVSLAPQTPNGQWQSNPTLAAGDVKISLDGGALANLNTLPVVTPASSKAVKVTLSQAETNADNIVVLFSDAAGAEWCDLTINLQTAAKQFDDLAIQSDLTAVKNKTDSLTFTVAGMVDSNVVDWKGSAAPAMTGDAYARIGAAGAGLTALGDTRIAHLDADVSTRSTYAGADTAGTTTLLSRLTSTRAGLLDHLDADISSRMATFSYTAPDNASITAIKAKTDNLPSDPADQSLIIAATDSLASQISGLNNLSQADVRNAVGLASANLDTQIAALATAAGLSDLSDGISASFTALQNHGDSTWSTATGFSTLDAGDVTAAVWDVLAADHVDAGSTGQSLFYAQQGATSADSKANDIYGDTQAIRSVTDGLVQTAGKLWVLDDQGNPLRHSDEIAADFSTLSGHGDATWATATGFATPGDVPAAADNAAAVLAATYEGSETVQDHFRLARAALYGKANGLATTSAHYRDAADTKNRISAVVDADGNRSSVSTDAS